MFWLFRDLPYLDLVEDNPSVRLAAQKRNQLNENPDLRPTPPDLAL